MVEDDGDRSEGRIGIVGLGRMGGALARRLLSTGSVVGYDVDEARLHLLSKAGVRAVGSAADVAREADVVLVLLPSAAALSTAALGPTGLEGGVGPGSVVVEMSTLALEDKLSVRDRLAARGAAVLDAPISGTAVQAETGDTVVYASGDSGVIERVRPLLRPAAREVLDVGQFGDGMRMKLLANLLVAVHIAATGEVLALATRMGLDPAASVPMLALGAGSSRMLEVRGPMMAARAYEPASMSVGLFLKDLELIEKVARSAGAAVPLFDVAAAAFRLASSRGSDRLDTASVHEVSLAAGMDPGSNDGG
jgi:3-hydroxyisobutyrate dehydrogenase-like beta-hydroxyacid dehydrogenase